MIFARIDLLYVSESWSRDAAQNILRPMIPRLEARSFFISADYVDCTHFSQRFCQMSPDILKETVLVYNLYRIFLLFVVAVELVH